MKLAIYSTKQYDRKYLELVNQQFGYELEFFDFLLSKKTAKTAAGCKAVCIFVNDDGSREVLEELAALGVEILALRCAGFNNVDLDAAKELGIKVVRVPAYSPEAVAEHAVGMMMCLNRRIHRAYQRTRDANFSLEGLIGFNMHNRTAGVIGTGKIGVATMRILKGFGMKLLAYDPFPSEQAFILMVIGSFGVATSMRGTQPLSSETHSTAASVDTLMIFIVAPQVVRGPAPATPVNCRRSANCATAETRFPDGDSSGSPRAWRFSAG